MAWRSEGSAAGQLLSAHDLAGETTCLGKVFEIPALGLASRVPSVTMVRNCTGDEGKSFEVGNQVLVSSHRKPLSSKATVVNVAETSGHDLGRHG